MLQHTGVQFCTLSVYLLLSEGPDAEEAQAEAEEVISQWEGRTFGESLLQRPTHLNISVLLLLPASCCT